MEDFFFGIYTNSSSICRTRSAIAHLLRASLDLGILEASILSVVLIFHIDFKCLGYRRDELCACRQHTELTVRKYGKTELIVNGWYHTILAFFPIAKRPHTLSIME